MTAFPKRTCLGCRKSRPQRRLLRLIRGEDGRARFDLEGRRAGRGAYVCPDRACLDRALTRGRLAQAFRRPSEPPDEDHRAAVAGIIDQEGTRLWQHA
jgi:predicted RNA-binding protein YlxR (DUF448 family)